jgi:hypothetical protein
MCEEAYRFGRKNTASDTIKHRQTERPMEKSPQLVILYCSKCFQQIGKGKNHVCTTKKLVDNQIDHLEKRGIIDKVAGQCISRKLSFTKDTDVVLPRPL